MKVIIFKEIPKRELNDSAMNKRETITFQTNTELEANTCRQCQARENACE